jgi:hypothetical protein
MHGETPTCVSAGRVQTRAVHADRDRKRNLRWTAVGVPLGLMAGAICGCILSGGLHGCLPRAMCDPVGVLVIMVSPIGCDGKVITAGACSSAQCEGAPPPPACCTEWGAFLAGDPGQTCIVSLTLPDGGTVARDVVLVKADPDSDCSALEGEVVNF